MKVKPGLNPEWKQKMGAAIADLKDAKLNGGPKPKDIEVRTSFALAKRWLIMMLSENEIPFQFKNLGAGVSVITTDVDRCPMCKRLWQGETK